MEADNERNHS